MPEGRPAIPQALDRKVRTEAGHRCAIPTCRANPIVIAHIDPYSKVKEHTFDNLIALCPNCHARFDGGQIDRQSMLHYKANLSVVNGRYGDLEQRVLSEIGESNGARGAVLLPGGMELLMKNSWTMVSL